MNRAMASENLCMAIFAAACFLVLTAAGAQEARSQNGVGVGTQHSAAQVSGARISSVQPVGAQSSSPLRSPSSAATNYTTFGGQAGPSGEQSSWTAGKGSFGSGGGSAWTPGSGTFGLTRQAGGIWRVQPASALGPSSAPGARPATVPATNASSVHRASSPAALTPARKLAPGNAHSYISSIGQRHGVLPGGARSIATKTGAPSRTSLPKRGQANGRTILFPGFGSNTRSAPKSKSSMSSSSEESPDLESQSGLGTTPQ